jgi:hypothetical protein
MSLDKMHQFRITDIINHHNEFVVDGHVLNNRIDGSGQTKLLLVKKPRISSFFQAICRNDYTDHLSLTEFLSLGAKPRLILNHPLLVSESLPLLALVLIE